MMRNYKGFVIGSFSLIFLIAGWLVSAEETAKKGTVTYADGEVKRQAIAAESWLNAPVNTEVITGDRVRTYRESRAELDLAQLDVIRLAPRTTIQVDKLYEETKEKKIQTSIKLEEGDLWASVHEVEASTNFDISAPVAAAAITGTILSLSVDEDSTTQLKVYKGEVEIRRLPQQLLKPQKTGGGSLAPTQIQGPTQVQGPKEVTADEWIKIVKTMQQITIDPQGRIVNFSGFSPKDPSEMTDWVKWNHELDRRRMENLMQRMKEQK